MVWAVGGPKWRSLRLYLGLHTPLLGPDPAEEHQNIQKQSKTHPCLTRPPSDPQCPRNRHGSAANRHGSAVPGSVRAVARSRARAPGASRRCTWRGRRRMWRAQSGLGETHVAVERVTHRGGRSRRSRGVQGFVFSVKGGICVYKVFCSKRKVKTDENRYLVRDPGGNAPAVTHVTVVISGRRSAFWIQGAAVSLVSHDVGPDFAAQMGMYSHPGTPCMP